MALNNLLVQSCCNFSITKVVKYTSLLSVGVVFQDALSNCYQVIGSTNATPNIFLTDLVPLYETCDDCLIDLPPCEPQEPTTIWLVQSCCDSAITQIVVANNIVPGNIFQDSFGDCYTVLTATEGNPTIVRGNDLVYGTCEDCGTCIAPSSTPTPTITQTPFPTPSKTPSVTVTPSPSPVTFVNSSPSPTPTVTISRTPSVTPSINTPVCKCITFTNTSPTTAYDCFYNTCEGVPNVRFGLEPQTLAQVCGSNPSTGDPAVTFYTGSYCQNEECVAPDISPSPTPTPSATLVTAPVLEPEPLCMDIVFGPAPSPSATPSITVSVTPSITVSPSSYPINPSLSPAATPSVTPSVTPSKTPSISVSTTPSITPSVTPTRTVTPSVTPSKTPSITVSPSKTPSVTPSPSSDSIVVPECSVIYNGQGANQVYAYNSTTNVSTLLNLGTSPLQVGSSDVAHTTTKLWLYASLNGTTSTIFEYNITLSPFTSVYNRAINIPVGIALGAGICAIDNTTLLSSDQFNNDQIIQITLNNDNVGQTQPATATITNLFSLPSGRIISGDLLYTTNGKIIITTQTRTPPNYYFIEQYALGTNGIWQQEFEQNITTTAPFPLGLATINNGIYIFSGTNLKQISTTFPYTVTQVNNIGKVLAGASQVPSCNNVSFQPNIIAASPSPSPTPTKTTTPSITASPSITPTRTPTPTPSKSPPNNIPCVGGTSALPLPGNSITINGVTITASGKGSINQYPNLYASCNTTTPANAVWLGLSGAFEYTLTFSQPINNINLLVTALGSLIAEATAETFIFNTSGGTPTIASSNNCLSTISGNTIIANNPIVGTGGGGLFTISAPSSFNTLTITGPGGFDGSLFGIDCTSVQPPSLDCVSCNPTSLPRGTGTITNGNLTVNTTYSGPSLVYTGNFTNPISTCTGLSSPVSPLPVLNLGANSGAFIYTLNFNQSVNNIKFLISGGGTGIPSSPEIETFTFNTNGGVPILSACGVSCGATVDNNVLQLGESSPYGSGILTQLKATNPYNQIIITGPGGGAGSSFAICLDTTVPLPSTSPSVTPSVTVSPSKTPSVTATPSISISATPSITPSITVTPSITPSPSPGFAANCSTMLYRTQTKGYGSYNFTTNTATALTVAANPYPANDNTNAIPTVIANTSNKMWVYATGAATSEVNLRESNIVLSPFSSTFNRNIALPTGLKPNNGLFALNNSTLVGSYKITSPDSSGNLYSQPIVEITIPADGTLNPIATFVTKCFLPIQTEPVGGLVVTNGVNPKLIILVRDTNTPTIIILLQYNYTTGDLELYKSLSPTITTPSGLVELNGNIYIIGYNMYKIDTTTPYALTLVQNPGLALINASQLANCIDTNFTIPNNCDTCTPALLPTFSPVTYGGVTLTPSFTGVTPNSVQFSDIACSGSNTILNAPNTVWLGWYPGDFTYTITFSQPVNDIVLLLTGMGDRPISIEGHYESFAFNTNGGIPSLTACKGCFDNINGNTVTGSVTGINNLTQYISGGGFLKVHANSLYTTLTISGPGGAQGTTFGICSTSIVPAPAVSPSPSPSPSLTPTPTPTPSPSFNPNALGCVYYSNYNKTYNYNPITNVSTQVTLPTDTFSSFAETHTLTKYFKGNQTSTIKEWIPTNNPTILALNRTITISGITSMFGNYFTFLQAINDTTLLTTITNLASPTPAGTFTFSLVRMNITNNTVTSAQITTLFNIYAPAGLDSILLTSTNKLITIGRRNTPTTQEVTYLSQYSYPGGILEADIDISSTVLTTNVQRYLFESNGNLFVSIQYPPPTSTIYSINLNSPYTLTPVYTNMNLFGATFNSSINCNTVSLNTVTNLECAYYSDYDGQLYSYSLVNNTSVAITTPFGNTINCDTHTLTKYWRGDSSNTIYEWVPSNVPNTLVSNRTISLNTGYTSFYYLQAIDNNTLLTILSNNSTPTDAMLARIDVTSNTVTSAQVTPLFNISTTSLGSDSMLLTSTNKLLFVGTRFNSNNIAIRVLKQYSYPNGVLETEIDLSTIALSSEQVFLGLFESGGEIYLAKSFITAPISTALYKISPTSPYPITTVFSNIAQGTKAYNSSINCNTANLNVSPQPSPSPTPTPSTSPPSAAFRTIYKYLDIQ